MKSILEWLGALRRAEVERDAFEQAIQEMLQRWTRQFETLERLEIGPEDHDQWKNLIHPGLSAAYRCLISAAQESLLYSKKNAPEYLPGIYQLLDSFARIHGVLSLNLKNLSGWTQEQIARELSAQIQPYQPQKTAFEIQEPHENL